MLSKRLLQRASRPLSRGKATKGKLEYPSFVWKKDSFHVKQSKVTNKDEAYFCGRKPGQPLEDWEKVYLVGTVLLVGMAAMEMSNEEDSLQSWAHKEAIARNKAKANGIDIVYGKWYNKLVVKEFESDDNIAKNAVKIGYEFEFEGEDAEEEEE